MSQTFEAFGKYILLEKLATGGMAEVYLAKNMGANGIGKLVAMKRILPQFSETPEFIDMFKDEAKIAVNLSHSNIVSIHEFGMQNSQFFLVMDYVEGRNLRQILNKMKKSGLSFSTEQVLYMIKEVAAGLDHAHRCLDSNTGKPLNITHRDMSPQNVMISFEGETKVVDFGIAKAEIQIETTRAGTLKGKFGYMSPEQAEGQIVDLRTDIFSLGIVLWELLANDRLFVANNEINTLRKIRDCQVPSLRKINPNIPPELERIANKALAKDRNLRYQTAAAFHRELSRFLNRQYPDFSPHDFSVFIKTLFASEILENRRKIIEYSKIDLGALTGQNQNQQSNQQAQPQQQYQQPVSNQRGTTDPSPTTTERDALPRDSTSHPKDGTSTENSGFFTNADFKGSQVKDLPDRKAPYKKIERPNDGVKSESLREAKQAQAQQERNQARKGPVRDGNPRDGAEIGDYRALRVDPASAPPGYSQDMTYTGTNIMGYTRTRSGTGSYNVRSQFKTRAAWIQIAQNAIMAIIGVAIAGSIGVSFYNPCIVPEGTPLIGPSPGSCIPGSQLMDGRIDIGSTKATPIPLPSPSSTPVKTQASRVVKVSILSQPQGAEVWVNGNLVKDVTPTSYEFIAGEEYMITVRKGEQYVPYQQKTRFTVDSRLSVPLQRIKVATLDIAVVGSGEIYINNARIAIAGPVYGYNIPANEDVVVRAYDPKTGASAEQTIRLAEGLNKRIKLVPRLNVVPTPGPVPGTQGNASSPGTPSSSTKQPPRRK